MPVTARLSRKFYEKFGDELTNELVEWFNQVDTAYRSELHEINDLNYARFEAKLEQKVVELRTEIRAGAAEFRTEMHTGLARLEGGLLARIALAESRQTRVLLATWIATFGALAALIKL